MTITSVLCTSLCAGAALTQNKPDPVIACDLKAIPQPNVRVITI
jgi:hypothetical protein